MSEPTQVTAIEKRIADLTKAVEQSIANHNALLGRLSEAQHVLSIVLEAAEAIAPVIETAVEAVESVS